MKRTLRLVAFAAAFLLASCSGLNVQPARQAHDVLSPDHLRYVDADPTLDADEKLARRLAWKGFDAWVRAHEDNPPAPLVGPASARSDR